MDAEAVKAALEQRLGLEHADCMVEISASNVTFSPHYCVFVWLTSDREEGPHIIVSDAAELGEEGYFVGLRPGWGAGADVVTKATLDEAVTEAVLLVKEN